MELRGVFAPVTTPFDPVTGDADVVSMRANLRAWLRAPISGVVLFGSTGEGPILDEDEKARLTAATRSVVDGSRLLLAGTGAESTRATIRQTRAVAAAGCSWPARGPSPPAPPSGRPGRWRRRARTPCWCSRPRTTSR
ncbi:MAG TPA: dihydrodipicolinate synthase family protein [Longimicrobium sp.]|nr:dihydrodipicolinate synthase family protein [Longimicrobium sp.]